MGDLTDQKDGHGAELVNYIVSGLTCIAALGTEVIVLQGNHDYQKEGHPFFGFLSQFPGITFVTKPEEVAGDDALTLFLPHTRTPLKDWADLDFSHFNYVCMHQTVSGSVASNGMKMEGEMIPDLSNGGKVWSGDIHVPQVIGAVEYVGSPYHVHFGDKFTPRLVFLPGLGEDPIDVHFRSIQRYVLKVQSWAELTAARRKLHSGDQVRVEMLVQPHERHAWAQTRRDIMSYLTDLGVEVHGIKMRCDTPDGKPAFGTSIARTSSPEELLLQFVQREGWSSDAFDLGMELL